MQWKVLRSNKNFHLFSHSCRQIHREKCSNINQEQKKAEIEHLPVAMKASQKVLCWCHSYLTFFVSHSSKGQNYSKERKSMEIMTSKLNRCVSPGSSYPFWWREEKGLFLRRAFELRPRFFFSNRSSHSGWIQRDQRGGSRQRHLQRQHASPQERNQDYEVRH